jgi:hypothetical protein
MEMLPRPAVIAMLGLAFGLAGLIALRLDAAPAPRGGGGQQTTTVDVELVLAVDISYSMDPDELALQREGYVKALTSAEFLNALRQGIHGKIAVTYFEWAGFSEQRVVVPWRVVDGPESADPARRSDIHFRRAAFWCGFVRHQRSPRHPPRDRYFRRRRQ